MPPCKGKSAKRDHASRGTTPNAKRTKLSLDAKNADNGSAKGIRRTSRNSIEIIEANIVAPGPGKTSGIANHSSVATGSVLGQAATDSGLKLADDLTRGLDPRTGTGRRRNPSAMDPSRSVPVEQPARKASQAGFSMTPAPVKQGSAKCNGQQDKDAGQVQSNTQQSNRHGKTPTLNNTQADDHGSYDGSRCTKEGCECCCHKRPGPTRDVNRGSQPQEPKRGQGSALRLENRTCAPTSATPSKSPDAQHATPGANRLNLLRRLQTVAAQSAQGAMQTNLDAGTLPTLSAGEDPAASGFSSSAVTPMSDNVKMLDDGGASPFENVISPNPAASNHHEVDLSEDVVDRIIVNAFGSMTDSDDSEGEIDNGSHSVIEGDNAFVAAIDHDKASAATDEEEPAGATDGGDDDHEDDTASESDAEAAANGTPPIAMRKHITPAKGREYVAMPATWKNERGRERVQTWDTDIFDATPIKAMLPSIKLGIREMICYFPQHLAAVAELNLRARSSGFNNLMIAELVLWHRGRLTKAAVKRVDAKFRKQVSTNNALMKKEFEEEGMEDPKVMDHDRYENRGASRYHVGHVKNRAHREKALGLYPLAAMADGVRVHPSKADRGLMTQVIMWAKENDDKATIEDIDRIVEEQGFELPSEALDTAVSWDKEAFYRARNERVFLEY
ncbi:hypothetical protein K470DRAFT_258483 [Piedraia hortae CBS 480.64]|uniref:Uncharacterized protein n=1 Tax=Piedraia hortae CBS 480.64 TaxID=1314780 RepID=A0A6A7BXT2_9PEZI|nr:hypothetical protein K470DRAFT_258483 [Piedraia hortae CBS 480.64]